MQCDIYEVYRTRTRLKTALVVKMLTKLCEKLGIDDI